MNQLKFAIAALAGAQFALASHVSDPTPEQTALYPEWAEEMEPWVEDYAWQPYEVTTADGNILTMFKISKRLPETEEKPQSVLFQHKYGFDSTDVLRIYNRALFGDKPQLLHVVDANYEVWMGNFRGTRYSLQHTNPDPEYNETQEYWNYSYAELGLKDLPAFMDKIYEENGGEKMYMIDYASGTTVSQYALSHEQEESYFVNRLHKLIQWAPCTGVIDLAAQNAVVPLELYFSFLENGFYRVGGPDFEETILPVICANYGEEVCAQATSEGVNRQANSIVLLMHVTMNQHPDVRRFQELITPAEWIAGKRTSEPVNVSEINLVPVEFFAHIDDDRCTYEGMLEMANEIQSPVRIVRFNDEPFFFSKHNWVGGLNTNARFLDNVLRALNPYTEDEATCSI